MAHNTESTFPDPNAYYPIVGIQDGLDPDKEKVLRKVGIRMDLDDWFTSKDLVHQNQRALFFPAFKKFTEMKPEEKFSFFQIAGIHCYPIGVPWDEPHKTKARPYCAHNRITFSTWHRPYLLLFEQVIYTLMKERVAEFPSSEQAELLEAAESWRLPYWDAAMKKPDPTKPPGNRDYNVPLVFRQKEVDIRVPVPLLPLPGQGQPGFPNALYQFTMPGKIRMGDKSLGKLKIVDVQDTDDNDKPVTMPFGDCWTTSRQPTVRTFEAWAEGEQNNDGVADALRNYTWTATDDPDQGGSMTEGLREAFFKLFTIENFEDFGTTHPFKADPPRKDLPFDSSEGIHNSLHNWCGGPIASIGSEGKGVVGHMSEVPVAAFDPIFWFHHCNIDRLVAIWQVLHDDSWFDPRRTKDLPTDDLRPFHRDTEGNYWNSNLAREVTSLGYTYPWLEKWQYEGPDGTYDKEKHQRELTQRLTFAYNSPRSAALKAELTRDPGQPDGVGLMPLQKLMAATHRDPVDMTVNDYVINVEYEKLGFAGGQPFAVHIFIGKVPNEVPYNFQRDGATLVGEVYNFTSRPVDCDNCRDQEEERALATGRVTLTNALITRWKNQVQHEPEADVAPGPRVLASMEPADVVQFLTGNLHWRVTSVGGLVNPARIPSLKVSLAVGKADHFADPTKLSRFYDYKGAFEPTLGRPGGAGPQDRLYPEGYEYHT